jgi:hypothetical protein
MEDPYDEFHVAHPLYLKGVAQERERIRKWISRDFGAFQLVYEKLDNPHDQGIRRTYERILEMLTDEL